MAVEIRVPKLGPSMIEGTLTEWLVKDGAAVEAGQPLYAIEIEKSTNEVEATVSGKIRILEPFGSTLDVGHLIAMIE